MKSKNQLDMRTGGIAINLIKFAIPLILTSMLQLLYNAADVIVVGRFAGTEALSAVGSTGPVIGLIINLFMGLSVGTNVVTSRFFGADDFEGMQKSIHTSIAISLICGVVLTFVGIGLTTPLLSVMNTPDDVIGGASIYMRIFFGGMIFNLTYNIGAAALRAIGDTRRPLIILAISGLANVGLNLLFVIPLKMGVAGVALATIISQAISMVWIIVCLVKEESGIKLNLKQLKIDVPTLLEIARIGIPAGIQSSMFAISNTLMQSAINYFGTTAMAANAAAGNVEGFIFVTINSFNQAIITFTSQNAGAKQFKRVRKSWLVCNILAVLAGFAICIPVYFLSPQLIWLYDSTPEVIAMGVVRLQFMAIVYFLWGIMDVTTGQMRGLGSSIMPTAVSLLGICAFRVFWVLVIFENFKSLQTLYYCYPISWVFTFLLVLPFYIVLMKKFPKEDIKEV